MNRTEMIIQWPLSFVKATYLKWVQSVFAVNSSESEKSFLNIELDADFL